MALDLIYAEFNGRRFRLLLNNDGHPYVLRRFNYATKDWDIVWADWRNGLPTGERAKVLMQMGYRWINTEHPCRWEIAS